MSFITDIQNRVILGQVRYLNLKPIEEPVANLVLDKDGNLGTGDSSTSGVTQEEFEARNVEVDERIDEVASVKISKGEIGTTGVDIFTENQANIVIGSQVSSNTATIPYAITPNASANIWFAPVVSGDTITIEWNGGEATRFARWDTGNANNQLVSGFVISNRFYQGVVPDGATRLVVGVKRPSETPVYPDGFIVYKGTEKPSVNSIFGLPLSAINQSVKLEYNGYNDVTTQISGVPIRFVLPDGYTRDGNKSKLMLTAHGNAGNITYNWNAEFRTYARQNNIVLALINLQDKTVPPFDNRASGYGNQITVNRMIQLYEWCQKFLNVDVSAILQGQSMGGLTVGVLAATRPFPIRFVVQIGATPDLLYRFNGAPENVKLMIRNAYGMASDGTDDVNAENYFKGNDWFALNMLTINGDKVKVGFPPVYMYAGNGDTTFSQFGGAAKYEEVRDSILNAGQRSTYTEESGVAHGSPTLFTLLLNEGVFEKELKLIY